MIEKNTYKLKQNYPSSSFISSNQDKHVKTWKWVGSRGAHLQNIYSIYNIYNLENHLQNIYKHLQIYKIIYKFTKCIYKLTKCIYKFTKCIYKFTKKKRELQIKVFPVFQIQKYILKTCFKPIFRIYLHKKITEEGLQFFYANF